MPMHVLIDLPVQPDLLRKLQNLQGVAVHLAAEKEVTPVPPPVEVPGRISRPKSTPSSVHIRR